ncbi:GntR family transcriptional regulator [Oceanobacillus sojae]|uniref:GntR family transcriptional regulator n=1 Tax=Oceanobacillus sojae TaxID=582851 RepID=UPI0009884726|nr:GntR family transcriptional regulator [Oceanobacillus sojae]MCT1904671.1 GntR family transcriptional regulator [Oceanobacillus sojae]
MIDDTLYIPLHVQLSKSLEEKIKAQEFIEKIPSERELMDMYSVSRTTVREAVTKLVNDGLLIKVHGKGTYVNKKPPIQEWLSSLNSFTETVRRMGMVPTSKLLTVKKLSADKHGIEIFKEEVFMIERLRYADEKPIAIERHYYPLSIGERLSEFNLDKETIYDLLENELGIVLDEAEQYITTEIIEDHLAKYLEIPDGSNVLLVERTIVDDIGNVVEYYIGQYRPDMYTFRIKTKRNINKK